MSSLEFNNFIKRLRQYKQHTAEQKEQEKMLKEQKKAQKKQAREQAAELKKQARQEAREQKEQEKVLKEQENVLKEQEKAQKKLAREQAKEQKEQEKAQKKQAREQAAEQTFSFADNLFTEPLTKHKILPKLIQSHFACGHPMNVQNADTLVKRVNKLNLVEKGLSINVYSSENKIIRSLCDIPKTKNLNMLIYYTQKIKIMHITVGLRTYGDQLENRSQRII